MNVLAYAKDSVNISEESEWALGQIEHACRP